MMKNKTTKMLVNGAVFAAMAALGIAAFQLGTSPKDETDKIAEAPVEMVAENPVEPEADSMIDVGNSNVEASMESVPEEETEVTAAPEGRRHRRQGKRKWLTHRQRFFPK